MRMVTPNLAEAAAVEPGRTATTPRRPRRVRRHSQIAGRRPSACVTCGARGAVRPVRTARGRWRRSPRSRSGGDPCGAGDRFASRLAGALADGPTAATPSHAVDAATRFVAAGGAMAARLGPVATVAHPVDELPARVREQGGTFVATGGCFDLLHPGHVRTLEAARALGDCLVVCLNSDASVRRLKGDGPSGRRRGGSRRRPASAALRRRGPVFDEDTPATLLKHLRPDVWVKGGDYAPEDLPEAEVIARWGGRVALVRSWRAAPAPG